MRSQRLGSVKTQASRTSLRWFTLGFTLVLGIALIMLGIMLLGVQGGRAGDAEAQAEDAARALMLQRFGEWQLDEGPRTTTSEAWQRYRAGERAAYPDARAMTPDGWDAYRAGERAPLATPAPGAPEPEATDRAGEQHMLR